MTDFLPALDDYDGIVNAWGQYGVDVSTDVTEDDGRPVVCLDTSSCETALALDGAEELARRLTAAIEEIR